MNRSRCRVILTILLLLSVSGVVLFPLLGRTCYPFHVFFSPPGSEGWQNDVRAMIFWEERFPNTILAWIAGCGLALCGVTLQALFRNPLATPFTLGIASGASFGATLYFFIAGSFPVLATLNLRMIPPPVTWAGFSGAILATAIVYGLARGRSVERMLLAGVAVSYFFSSLILCFQFVADPSRTFQMIRWTMGGIDYCDYRTIITLGTMIGSGALILTATTRELNLLLTGEERASSLGMSVPKYRLFLFILTSLMVGAIVSVCGPIGFVGLMVPHCCRLLLGNDHRYLVPGAALLGGFFLVACFTIARTAVPTTVLPVGMITSLLGGPFFLAMLVSKR